jgi:hypothetical protein
MLAFIFSLTLASCTGEEIVFLEEELEGPALFSKSGKSAISSVSGQGGLSFGEGTKTQHFSFHASVDGDGNVSGSFESKSPSQNSLRSHGTIDCVTFLDDKTAVLSGTITKVVKGDDGTFSNYEIGSSVWFKVIDNGEGKKSAPDQFSDYYGGVGGCFPYNVGMRGIETGNIQIKR